MSQQVNIKNMTENKLLNMKIAELQRKLQLKDELARSDSNLKFIDAELSTRKEKKVIVPEKPVPVPTPAVKPKP